MTWSSSSIVAARRSPARPGPRCAARLCSVRPAPNRRWMTWSCRSAAMRSRSSSIAARCCLCTSPCQFDGHRRLIGEASAISSSPAVNGGRPRSRAAVSTPRTRSEPVSGTSRIGPTSKSTATTGGSCASDRSDRSGRPLGEHLPGQRPFARNLGGRACPRNQVPLPLRPAGCLSARSPRPGRGRSRGPHRQLERQSSPTSSSGGLAPTSAASNRRVMAAEAWSHLPCVRADA